MLHRDLRRDLRLLGHHGHSVVAVHLVRCLPGRGIEPAALPKTNKHVFTEIIAVFGETMAPPAKKKKIKKVRTPFYQIWGTVVSTVHIAGNRLHAVSFSWTNVAGFFQQFTSSDLIKIIHKNTGASGVGL